VFFNPDAWTVGADLLRHLKPSFSICQIHLICYGDPQEAGSAGSRRMRPARGYSMSRPANQLGLPTQEYCHANETF
jgi:hypothetical protein